VKRRYVVAVHAGYWLLYLLLLTLVLTLATRHLGRPAPLPSGVLRSTPGYLLTVSTVIAFYSAYFVLFPTFLARRRFVALVATSLATALGPAALAIATLYLIAGPVPGVFAPTRQAITVEIGLGLVALIYLVFAW
jgi:hypothetical protein